ncbi:MAG TPA: SBBP repeat-containing protein [Thermodesulfobacteriota bacterium]|nr:SBBP repeat-containing protein [Thermodesulfobacteriota bacterium]
MRATINQADIAGAGTATITVFNPAPGGGTSNGVTFNVTTSALWTGAKEFGSSGDDQVTRIKVDSSGNVFIAGFTTGTVGTNSFGGEDAFLVKTDNTGRVLWKLQWGTAADDQANDVKIDSSGNAYVVGFTGGNLGGTNLGGMDAFLTIVNPSGAITKTVQWGTSGGDAAYGVALDSSGNIFVAGSTGGTLGASSSGGADAFLTRFDASGNIKAPHTQWGTASAEIVTGADVDGSGNVYVAGYTSGNLGGTAFGNNDAFMTKLNASGTVVKTVQWGTGSDDVPNRITVMGNSAYIAGYTFGSLGFANLGGPDAFVSRINLTSLTVDANYQVGTPGIDSGIDVAADSSGNISLAGTSGIGTFTGGPNVTVQSMFVVKFNSSGTIQWARIFGTTLDSFGVSVALDSQGNEFMAGHTRGSVTGFTNSGGLDVVVVKFDSNGNQQ